MKKRISRVMLLGALLCSALIGEKNNVADQYPEVMARLRAKMNEIENRPETLVVPEVIKKGKKYAN